MDDDERYATLLQAVRSSPHNLVSRRAMGQLETRHLPESLAVARLLPAGPARLLDVGSGGGFPGLVIGMARPDLTVTLVEATGKKARFLQDTAGLLGVTADVIGGRIEDLHDRLAGQFDLVTARAVAPLDVLVRWSLPALRPGGLLYAVKGQHWNDELRAAERALTAMGGYVHATPPDPRALDTSVDPLLQVVIIGRRVRGGSGPARPPYESLPSEARGQGARLVP